MSCSEISSTTTLNRLETTLSLLQEQVETRFHGSFLSITLLIQTTLRPYSRNAPDERTRQAIDRLLHFIDAMDVHAEHEQLQQYQRLLLESLCVIRTLLAVPGRQFQNSKNA